MAFLFAFANEANLFLGHEVSGIIEQRMHTMVVYLAFKSSLFLLGGFWSRGAWAAVWYCSVLQGAVQVETGVWLDSFRDSKGNRVWGLQQHHKYMLQAHMLLSMTAMALMVLWICRLSATMNTSSCDSTSHRHVVQDDADSAVVLGLGAGDCPVNRSPGGLG